MLLFTPLFIYIIKRNWKAYIPFVIIATIIVGCKLSDDLFYQKQEWNYYKEYNEERSKLQDGQNQRFLNDFPENITQDDYDLMCWFLGDVNIISLDVLKELNNRAAKASSPIDKIKISLVQVCKRNICLLCLLYLILLCVSMLYKRKEKFLLFGYVVLVFLLMLTIGYVAHFKYRVFACVLLTEIMVAYTFLYKEVNKTLSLVITICSIAISCNLLCQPIRNILDRHLYSNRLQEQLSFLEAVPFNSYVVDLHCICHEQINPFHMESLHFPSYNFGWFANFPLNDRAHSFLDFIESDCFIFIDTTSPYNPHYALQLIQNSIETNYKCRTKITLYLENNNLQLYQIDQL